MIFNSDRRRDAGQRPLVRGGARGRDLWHTVRILPPTEFVWSKAFVQDRDRYDGADIAHVMLKEHENIDWRRLLTYMEPYWEVLLTHLLNFRFIYPTERDRVPQWLMDELTERLRLRSACRCRR